MREESKAYGNGVVKRVNNVKDGWVENCKNKMSLVLQIKPKILNPNISFELHYNSIQTGVLNYITTQSHFKPGPKQPIVNLLKIYFLKLKIYKSYQYIN